MSTGRDPTTAEGQVARDPAFVDVEEISHGLKSRTLRSGLVMLVGRMLHLAIAVGSTMVLARLLAPRDFGLLAMAMVVVAFVRGFGDFGLPMAVVHESQLDHGKLSRLFWINLQLNVLVASGMVLVAPAVAWFFNEQLLVRIILILTVGVFANGLSHVHLGLLRRQMRFTAIAVTEVVSMAAGATTAIALAIMGAGYWALLGQQLVMLVNQAWIPWVAMRWRPTRGGGAAHDQAEMQTILSYAKQTSGARLIVHLGSGVDRILVGHFLGPSQLGFYQIAHRWSAVPVRQLYLPLLGVAVASFSRLRSDVDKYRSYARKSFLGVFTLSLPALAFLLVCADDVLGLLLGPQWREAVPIFQALLAAVFFSSGTRVTKWVYLAEGQTKRQLTWALISTPVSTIGMLAGLRWGAVGIASGYAVATLLLLVPSVWYCLKTSPLSTSDFWRAYWRPALSALGAAGVLVLLVEVIGGGDILPLRLLWLLICAAVYSAVYVSCWLALPGGLQHARELVELYRAVRANQ